MITGVIYARVYLGLISYWLDIGSYTGFLAFQLVLHLIIFLLANMHQSIVLPFYIGVFWDYSQWLALYYEGYRFFFFGLE